MSDIDTLEMQLEDQIAQNQDRLDECKIQMEYYKAQAPKWKSRIKQHKERLEEIKKTETPPERKIILKIDDIEGHIEYYEDKIDEGKSNIEYYNTMLPKWYARLKEQKQKLESVQKC